MALVQPQTSSTQPTVSLRVVWHDLLRRAIMTFSSGLRVAVGTTVDLTVIAAGFAPVPGLSAVAGLVAGILKLCDDVRVNKNAIVGLGKRCNELLLVLDEGSKSTPDNLRIMVDSAQKLLEDIKEKIDSWANTSLFKLIFKRNDIAEGVKHYHKEIDSFLESFNIASHLKVHCRLTNFDRQRKEDQNELINYFSDFKNNHQIMQETIVAKVDEVKVVMGVIQETMGNFPVGDEQHKGLKKNLYTMQETSGQLLPRIELKSDEVRRVSGHPIRGSAVFDVWEGEYLGQAKCAIKAVRTIEVTPKIRDRLLREVKIWRKVWEDDKGEHILPFWGACFDDGPYPYVVSPWMEYGDAISYVNKYPYVNRKKIICRIAEGIRLLHSYEPPIVHGDIKGANILIDQKGNPLLADFGLSKMMENLTGMPFTQSSGVSESYRWFAPELCSAPGILSPASDMFAFAMTVVELITGQPPCSHIKRNPEVLIKMQQGERPLRSMSTEVIERGLDDKLWNLLTRCWAAEPGERPTIHEVISELPSE
ncbi:kinase-like protein [Sanghuangporus baumii]|uniref:Kinase-like protein n=1 Tax=Sanghuangporus baumii TaxID=108892 RepID=A0A9Q5NEX5_SANBA|nr:kinase-like protein [Sanghuangporus baumii]